MKSKSGSKKWSDTFFNRSEEQNIQIQGEVTLLVGQRLKFEVHNGQEGIYRLAVDGSETRVTVISQHQSGNLILHVPEGMVPGSYRFQIQSARQK